MKIAVTARGATPSTAVDESFGRSYWFLLYDPETKEWDALSNGINRIREEGAGARAAKMLVELGVGALITGQCGPRVLRIFREAGVEVFYGSGLMTNEAVDLWQTKSLQAIEIARCEGNPYCLLACNRQQVSHEENVQLGIIY